jgi:hypothetical protein
MWSCAQKPVVAFVLCLANAPICRQMARVYADVCFPTGRLRCVAGSSRGQVLVGRRLCLRFRNRMRCSLACYSFLISEVVDSCREWGRIPA